MQRFNILVIEQNKQDTCFAENHLRSNVISFAVVNNENDALMALNSRYDLILLDCIYVTIHFISILKQANSPNSKTRCIVMLNGCESHLKNKLTTLGFEDCLIKPITPALLETLIMPQQTDAIPNSLDYTETLLAKTYNNKSLALTIFKKLFVELPQQLADIKLALQNQQHQSALDITHKLHGSVSFCGFTDIQHHAYNLENCLLRKDYQAVHAYFSILNTAVVNFTAKENIILDSLK